MKIRSIGSVLFLTLCAYTATRNPSHPGIIISFWTALALTQRDMYTAVFYALDHSFSKSLYLTQSVVSASLDIEILCPLN